MALFKRKVKVAPNPWKEIPHSHDWLPASEGKELVCGLCEERKDA